MPTPPFHTIILGNAACLAEARYPSGCSGAPGSPQDEYDSHISSPRGAHTRSSEFKQRMKRHSCEPIVGVSIEGFRTPNK
jgi:hypothetical protein